jgi:HEAT repeat protein
MALVAMGGEAARALERALDDPATTWRIREHIPRTISRFAPAIAAPLLMARLTGGEVDEVVRYKCLRGIGRLVANNPELEIDRDRVTELLRGEVAAAIRLLRWRVAAALEAEGHRFAADPVHQLLIKLLSDKERHALERAFRLVGLLEPRENLEAIYRSLSSEDRRVHASGRELLSSLLDRELRAPLMSLTDDVSDAERLAGVSGGRDHRPSSYAALLVELAGHGDASLQCTAIRLAGVTGAPLEPILTALGDDPDRAVAEALSLRAGARRAREGIQ